MSTTVHDQPRWPATTGGLTTRAQTARLALLAIGWVAMAATALWLAHRAGFGQASVGLRIAGALVLAGGGALLQYACQRHALAGNAAEPQGLRLAMATGLGLLMLYAAEFACVALGIPAILLPAPSQVVQALWAQRQLLAADAMQTVVRAMLPGWLLGSALAIVTAMLCDRFSFLRRGLLPLGNFIAALPIVGLAPIFVMWFGFDWPSKAAIALVVTFFPVLINTAAGLQQAGAMERDLMHAYAASPMQTLRWLTLPAALPFIFNGLRITVPLALIGAIVAEFFGTPIVGMGFRMSVSLGQMAMPMVWAEIVVAAVIAMALVALLVALERRLTFWHPSLRT